MKNATKLQPPSPKLICPLKWTINGNNNDLGGGENVYAKNNLDVLQFLLLYNKRTMNKLNIDRKKCTA